MDDQYCLNCEKHIGFMASKTSAYCNSPACVCAASSLSDGSDSLILFHTIRDTSVDILTWAQNVVPQSSPEVGPKFKTPKMVKDSQKLRPSLSLSTPLVESKSPSHSLAISPSSASASTSPMSSVASSLVATPSSSVAPSTSTHPIYTRRSSSHLLQHDSLEYARWRPVSDLDRAFSERGRARSRI